MAKIESNALPSSPRQVLTARAAAKPRTRSNGRLWRQIFALLVSLSATRAFRTPTPSLRRSTLFSARPPSLVATPRRSLRLQAPLAPLHPIHSNIHYRHAYFHASSCRRRSPTTRGLTRRDDDQDVEANNKKQPSRRSRRPKDKYFDPQTTIALIGGQSVLILLSIVLAVALHTPNVGLGPRFSLDSASLQSGCLLAVPLGALAAFLDTIEDQYPALQDVTRATQRSVLGLLGGTFKPITGLLVAVVLGIAAGVGEEMLFRGLLQYELLQRTGLGIVGSLGLSSLVFGLLHAVTPLYALMAALASVYFGLLYVVFDNLAVPIACHSLYDIGALLYAHWTVAELSDEERADLAQWTGPGDPRTPEPPR